MNDLTPDARCRIRIGMSFATSARPELLKFVVSSRAKGCQVWMVAGSRKGAIRMSRKVYTTLTEAGVRLRRVSEVHDKFFAIYGKFGRAYQYRVYTGSQNWSQSALRSNDEIFVKLAPETAGNHPLYDGYTRHFNDAWAVGRTCTGRSFPCR